VAARMTGGRTKRKATVTNRCVTAVCARSVLRAADASSAVMVAAKASGSRQTRRHTTRACSTAAAPMPRPSLTRSPAAHGLVFCSGTIVYAAVLAVVRSVCVQAEDASSVTGNLKAQAVRAPAWRRTCAAFLAVARGPAGHGSLHCGTQLLQQLGADACRLQQRL